MKLKLPDITLVAFDGTCPELTHLAIADSLAQFEPAATLTFSPVPIEVPNATWIKVPHWSDRLDCSRFLWYELPFMVSTKFVLFIHWDAWVIDATQFRPEFLEYDYLGAPWWYDDGLNVGHGTLRSVRLMRFLADHKEQFPIVHPEDDVLSRRYRPALEQAGFRWPSEQIASQFMFECTRPSLQSRHFMFHDSFNFPFVLSGERLVERLTLMWQNEYLQRTGLKLAELQAGRRAIILPRLAAA
jgi:Protein of unknown function (DUF5672)